LGRVILAGNRAATGRHQHNPSRLTDRERGAHVLAEVDCF
jgi:hypothetical protein